MRPFAANTRSAALSAAEPEARSPPCNLGGRSGKLGDRAPSIEYWANKPFETRGDPPYPFPKDRVYNTGAGPVEGNLAWVAPDAVLERKRCRWFEIVVGFVAEFAPPSKGLVSGAVVRSDLVVVIVGDRHERSL